MFWTRGPRPSGWPVRSVRSGGVATIVESVDASASNGPGSFTRSSVRSSMARAAAIISSAAARRCSIASRAACDGSSLIPGPIGKLHVEVIAPHRRADDIPSPEGVGQDKGAAVAADPHEQLVLGPAYLELVRIEARQRDRQHVGAVAPGDGERRRGME